MGHEDRSALFALSAVPAPEEMLGDGISYNDNRKPRPLRSRLSSSEVINSHSMKGGHEPS